MGYSDLSDMLLLCLLLQASSLAMKGWEAFQPEEKKQHVDREGKLFLGNIWAVKQMMDEVQAKVAAIASCIKRTGKRDNLDMSLKLLKNRYIHRILQQRRLTCQTNAGIL